MTNKTQCQPIVDRYLASLSRNIEVEETEGGCVILTPFVRPDGDYLEIVAEYRGNGITRLTDQGETLAFLYLNGIKLSRQTMAHIGHIAQRFGVSLHINELVADIDPANTDEEDPFHNLVQAMTNVAALVESHRPYTRLQFDEEVEAEIIAQGRSYDPTYSVAGKREPHTVRFHVNSGLQILAQPFSRIHEQAARQLAERWNYLFRDILEENQNWHCYALLDDRGRGKEVWTEHAMTPLKDVAEVVPWSEKGRFLQVLSKTQ